MTAPSEPSKSIAHLAVEIGIEKANKKANDLEKSLKRIAEQASKQGWTIHTRPCSAVSGAGDGWSHSELSVVVHIHDQLDHIVASAILETSPIGIGYRPEERTGPEWYHVWYSHTHHYASRADVWLRRVLEAQAKVVRLSLATWTKVPNTTRYVTAI